MSNREVTELDFRMPEFRHAKVEDYEFRADGKLVRKDRWECAVHRIRSVLGHHGREFEIDEVIEAVRTMALHFEGWIWLSSEEDYPEQDEAEQDEASRMEIQLEDGSVLRHASYDFKSRQWCWKGSPIPYPVVAWRTQEGDQEDLVQDSAKNGN